MSMLPSFRSTFSSLAASTATRSASCAPGNVVRDTSAPQRPPDLERLPFEAFKLDQFAAPSACATTLTPSSSQLALPWGAGGAPPFAASDGGVGADQVQAGCELSGNGYDGLDVGPERSRLSLAQRCLTPDGGDGEEDTVERLQAHVGAVQGAAGVQGGGSSKASLRPSETPQASPKRRPRSGNLPVSALPTAKRARAGGAPPVGQVRLARHPSMNSLAQETIAMERPPSNAHMHVFDGLDASAQREPAAEKSPLLADPVGDVRIYSQSRPVGLLGSLSLREALRHPNQLSRGEEAMVPGVVDPGVARSLRERYGEASDSTPLNLPDCRRDRGINSAVAWDSFRVRMPSGDSAEPASQAVKAHAGTLFSGPGQHLSHSASMPVEQPGGEKVHSVLTGLAAQVCTPLDEPQISLEQTPADIDRSGSEYENVHDPAGGARNDGKWSTLAVQASVFEAGIRAEEIGKKIPGGAKLTPSYSPVFEYAQSFPSGAVVPDSDGKQYSQLPVSSVERRSLSLKVWPSGHSGLLVGTSPQTAMTFPAHATDIDRDELIGLQLQSKIQARMEELARARECLRQEEALLALRSELSQRGVHSTFMSRDPSTGTGQSDKVAEEGDCNGKSWHSATPCQSPPGMMNNNQAAATVAPGGRVDEDFVRTAMVPVASGHCPELGLVSGLPSCADASRPAFSRPPLSDPSHIESDKNEANSANGSVKCSLCGLSLMNQVTLQNHIRVVHDKCGDYECNDCGARFMWKSTLGNHVRLVHKRDRPYGCSACGLRFRWKSHLNEHVSVVHEKKQPFRCERCGKTFGRKNNMMKHSRRCQGGQALVT